MDKQIYDVAIIGSGAAGLMACYALSRSAFKILLIEKEPRAGKKLLATGNGHCNLTNMNISSENYRGTACKKITRFLDDYSADFLRNLFFDIGVNTRQDSAGRVYPYSDQASTILDMLRIHSNKYEHCNCKIERIEKNSGVFKLHSANEIFLAKKVIIACGGKSQQKLGSDGSGFALAQQLGHTMVEPVPSLCPVCVDSKLMPSLKGVRCRCKVSLVTDGNLIKSEHGELQMTENSLSGICIFQLSPYVNHFFSSNKKTRKSTYISVDLIPDNSISEIKEMLYTRIHNLSGTDMDFFLAGTLNKKIATAILKTLEIPISLKCEKLTAAQIESIAQLMKDWRFTPTGKFEFDKSQVTMGGVSAESIDFDTMESKNVPGIYFAGEIIDIDGDCGGYNLHFAFTSGYAAAKSCITALNNRKENKE